MSAAHDYGQNSNEAELKRKRRSLLGKIKRRRTTIFLLRREEQALSTELSFVEAALKEFKK